jgi:hypothetical protein
MRNMFIILGIATAVLLFVIFGIAPKQMKTSAELETQRQSAMDFFETEIKPMMADGVVYSVDEQHNQIKVRPEKWSDLDLDAKTKLVRGFSDYFEATGHTKRLVVLSSADKQKLAEYIIWRGIKIYP